MFRYGSFNTTDGKNVIDNDSQQSNTFQDITVDGTATIENLVANNQTFTDTTINSLTVSEIKSVHSDFDKIDFDNSDSINITLNGTQKMAIGSSNFDINEPTTITSDSAIKPTLTIVSGQNGLTQDLLTTEYIDSNGQLQTGDTRIDGTGTLHTTHMNCGGMVCTGTLQQEATKATGAFNKQRLASDTNANDYAENKTTNNGSTVQTVIKHSANDKLTQEIKDADQLLREITSLTNNSKHEQVHNKIKHTHNTHTVLETTDDSVLIGKNKDNHNKLSLDDGDAVGLIHYPFGLGGDPLQDYIKYTSMILPNHYQQNIYRDKDGNERPISVNGVVGTNGDKYGHVILGEAPPDTTVSNPLADIVAYGQSGLAFIDEKLEDLIPTKTTNNTKSKDNSTIITHRELLGDPANSGLKFNVNNQLEDQLHIKRDTIDTSVPVKINHASGAYVQSLRNVNGSNVVDFSTNGQIDFNTTSLKLNGTDFDDLYGNGSTIDNVESIISKDNDTPIQFYIGSASGHNPLTITKNNVVQVNNQLTAVNKITTAEIQVGNVNFTTSNNDLFTENTSGDIIFNTNNTQLKLDDTNNKIMLTAPNGTECDELITTTVSSNTDLLLKTQTGTEDGFIDIKSNTYPNLATIDIQAGTTSIHLNNNAGDKDIKMYGNKLYFNDVEVGDNEHLTNVSSISGQTANEFDNLQINGGTGRLVLQNTLLKSKLSTNTNLSWYQNDATQMGIGWTGSHQFYTNANATGENGPKLQLWMDSLSGLWNIPVEHVDSNKNAHEYSLAHYYKQYDASIDFNDHIGKIVRNTPNSFCVYSLDGTLQNTPKDGSIVESIGTAELVNIDDDKLQCGVVAGVLESEVDRTDNTKNYIKIPFGAHIQKRVPSGTKLIRVIGSGDIQIKCCGCININSHNLTAGDYITTTDIQKVVSTGSPTCDLTGMANAYTSYNGSYTPFTEESGNSGVLVQNTSPPRDFILGTSSNMVWRHDDSTHTHLLFIHGADWRILKIPLISSTFDLVGETWSSLNYVNYVTIANTTTTIGGYDVPNNCIIANASFTTSAGTSEYHAGWGHKQTDDIKHSYTVGKCLYDVDFSNSVATLQNTFADVEEWTGDDGLTYRSCLVPCVI